MKINDYSPIAIFTYNRPNHLQKLLYSLSKNEEIKYSDVYFFVDVDINSKADEEVIKLINKNWNFKSLTLSVNDENYGVRKNIVNGINEVLSHHSSIIVLEEDLEVSEYFLNFMNRGINFYKDDPKVWQISGYSLDTLLNIKNKAYVSSQLDCWGWATWSDRWNKFEKNFENKIKKLGDESINKFNLDKFNKLNYRQLELNEENVINTWAIFWYQDMFLNNAKTIAPINSLVKNNGFDGLGVHKSSSNFYNIKKLNNNNVTKLPNKINTKSINNFLIKSKFFKKNLYDYISYHSKKLKVLN
tara:strand:+ start:377 stop:1279 length:903 start_codon:yes stop_codon:yes gene_type:complete